MRRTAAFLICLLAAAGAVYGADAPDAGSDALRQAVISVCEQGLAEDPAYAAAIGPVTGIENHGSTEGGFRRVVSFGGERTATVQLTAYAGTIRRVRGELAEKLPGGDLRPVTLVDADGNCTVVHGRRLEYDGGGAAKRLLHLDAGLRETGAVEVLDPPVPEGSDSGGVAVAHVDSGVNYLLPHITERLARDADGTIMGFDFWDMDPRPFDLDTGRSPFFPVRHGSAVAGILLAEAPDARLIPFRYPRPDMTRMADVVDAAAAAGAGVVMMPLGSNSAEDWMAFDAATRRHPGILFVVSAGNDGRDLDLAPLYPAAFDLDNIVVVTSSDGFGRLAAGSNWGRVTVDLMVPGEKIATIDHRGAGVAASGSSFAVPRVAALAARMLGRHPDWQAPELIEALKARAGLPLERGGSPVRWGWIPNPADDG